MKLSCRTSVNTGACKGHTLCPLALNSSRLQPPVVRRATFKGPVDSDAVLCTNTSTYTVKKVETTNTLMLVSDTQVGTPTLAH